MVRSLAMPNAVVPYPRTFVAMLRALASHGYVPDRNMALEIRASGIHTEQLPQLA